MIRTGRENRKTTAADRTAIRMSETGIRTDATPDCVYPGNEASGSRNDTRHSNRWAWNLGDPFTRRRAEWLGHGNRLGTTPMWGYHRHMDQQSFLRLAKKLLGVSYPRLAAELGVSPRTIEKWSLDAGSRDHRRMPRIARKFLIRLLEDRKRAHLLTGDRSTAETIDALLTHVSNTRYLDALNTFDALQRSANVLVRVSRSPNKPRFFVDLTEKNAWEAEEEIANARKTTKASAVAR